MKNVIKQILKTKKDALILIASHINTDPDAVCSSVALAVGLKNLGYTNVKVLLNESGAKFYEKLKTFVTSVETSTDTNLVADLFCVCDLNTLDRLGEFSETFTKANRKIVIDHHSNLQLICSASYSIPELSSTCELVFNILTKLNALDKTSASLIYVGMRADTLDFKVQITKNTLLIASKCLSFNFDANNIINRTELKITDKEFNIFTKAYNKTECENGLKIVVLEEAELLKNNIFVSDAKKKALTLYYSIEGIKVICVLVNCKNKIMGSFRSYSEMDVNELAESLGGGGHKKACGFVNTTLPLEKVISQVKTYYKKNMLL